jgi:four helix bundle protein
MSPEELKARTKAYGLRVIRVVEALPKTQTSAVLGRQLLRCATSVGANYRAACRAKSPADFIVKLLIVEEETDESLYWMEMLVEADIVPKAKLHDLTEEGTEILKIVVASTRTARTHKR